MVGKRTFRLLSLILLTAVVLAGFAVPCADAAPMGSFRDVVKKVDPAVVYIEVKIAKEGGGRYWPGQETVTGSGSGVVIDAENGYVLTAAHVVNDADEAEVTLADGRKFEVIDVRMDAQTDVAIVQIDAENLTDAKLGDSDALEVGDWVLAMGSPLGKVLANSVSVGIVSGKGRKTAILGQLGIEEYIQTDAVINKGNSGGPLVSADGEVIGINSSIISKSGMSAGLGFAVPSNIIKPVVKELIEEGTVVRGWLGVTITSISDLKEEAAEDIPEKLKARGGAYVIALIEDGPADDAGLEKGDIITAVNGQEIFTSSELIKIISVMKPGEKVECELYRDGEKESVKVKLGTRPGSGDSGTFSALDSEDRKTASFKKLGLVVEDFEDRILGPRGARQVVGVRVKYVKSGSIAKDFGIMAGEVITKVDGDKVENSEQFNKQIKKADLDDGIVLTVMNKKGTRKVILMDVD